MENRPAKLAKLITVLAICFLGTCYLLTSRTTGSTEEGFQRQPPKVRRLPQAAPSRAARRDYSKFSHNVAQHQIACNLCHKFPSANWNKVRKGDTAFQDVTDYPQHSSCIGCHRQQFFRGARPEICTICHTNPSPKDGSRHPFPNPPEIFNASPKSQGVVPDFGISFPHDKHVEIVGREDVPGGARFPFRLASFEQSTSAAKSEQKAEESEPKSCAVCHKTHQPQGESDEEFVTNPPKDLAETAFWLKKGTFKTSPTHAVCFTCHTQDGLQPASSDCGACHKLLPPARQIQLTQAHDDFDPKFAATMGISDRVALQKWSKRDTVKFRHEWIPHASLSCVTCHTVATLNTLDPKTRTQVKSCGGEGTGCHIEATTDGILNLEFEKKKANPAFQCTKCHLRNGTLPAPQTHITAVAAAGKK